MLAHEEQDGDVVGVAAGDASQAVGCAGSGAGHGDADLTGGAGVAVGDLDAEAFVAGGEGADAGGAQGTPEGVQATAGESGYVAYSFLFEGFDDGFGSTHGYTSLSAEYGGGRGRPHPRGSPIEGEGTLVFAGMIGQRGDGVNRGLRFTSMKRMTGRGIFWIGQVAKGARHACPYGGS